MMRWARWCVAHPVATILLTLAVVLLGALAFPRLPVAPLPQAEFPTIRVSATLPGASPETMASAVATPLEVALSAVPGITEMTSSSSQGRVSITLQFSLDKDIDVVTAPPSISAVDDPVYRREEYRYHPSISLLRLRMKIITRQA